MKQIKWGMFTAKICLPEGVYTFPPESAEGKTLLYQIINGSLEDNPDCIAFTYEDYLKQVAIADILYSGNYSYVLLDRFDLYQTEELVKCVSDLSTKSIVLLDLKGELGKYTGLFGGCLIEFTENCLEVKDLWSI